MPCLFGIGIKPKNKEDDSRDDEMKIQKVSNLSPNSHFYFPLVATILPLIELILSKISKHTR
jgi:hypothetical protein